MDLEEAFQVVGEFGPYQKRAVAVLVLTQVSVFENKCCRHEKQRALAGTWHSANVTERRGFQLEVLRLDPQNKMYRLNIESFETVTAC